MFQCPPSSQRCYVQVKFWMADKNDGQSYKDRAVHTFPFANVQTCDANLSRPLANKEKQLTS